MNDRDVSRHDVARGAGTVALSRLGAVIEVVAQPAYTWLFGLATYGLYTALWAAVNIVENIVDLAMTAALQRAVPQAPDEERAHAAVKGALLMTLVPALLVAAAVALLAPAVATLFNAAPDDRATLVTAVRLFVWALPLWTFIEVATAAVRARRAFGPEVRLRIFWEQLTRLGFAILAAAAGLHSLGLMLAHLASLALTALLSLRLLARYYDLALLRRARLELPALRRLLGTGLALLPGNLLGRAFSDLPLLLLNAMLPGAAGASAAGLYGIARKVASIPLIVRQTFGYVLAPLASAQVRRDRAGVGPLYAFAVRLSTAVVLPLAAALMLLSGEILRLFAPEARAALPLLLALLAGRTVEAVAGPATPLVEVMGHRALPLVNALLGLTIWIAVAMMLVPRHGALGMAVAVACGIAVVALAAVAELRLLEGVAPFDRRFATAFLIAAAAAAVIGAMQRLLAPAGDAVEAGGILLLLPAAIWTSLRFGLDRADRAALGGAGRRLRLWSPAPD